MTDRPILFSAPMVRALLDGRKTQTRRPLSPQPEQGARFSGIEPDGKWLFTKGCYYEKMAGRFSVGDRLYVREEYYQFGHWEAVEGASTKGGRQKWSFVGTKSMVRFDAPSEFFVSRNVAYPGVPAWYKRLGRFMPRSLSRMTLIVTDVRVERLQDCSESDAQAEGLQSEIQGFLPAWRGGEHLDWRIFRQAAYADLWNSINGEGAWEANPWVSAVSFEVTKGNIDG